MRHPYHADPGYYANRADGLLASARDGTTSAVAAFADRGAPLTAEGARQLVAADHGCADWPALRKRLASLEREPFARAYRAIEAHDPAALTAELDSHTELPTEEGTNGNDLLAMATATCDERTVAVLLQRGADPSHPNAHGWTALHQAGYAGAAHLVPLLLAAGADPTLSARGDGGTPLVAALFWGNRRTAELLLAAGVHPRNLRAAAGVGDSELVRELLDSPEAGAHRGFYRPHSGFPHWLPSDDPQEVLDEALSYAARNDRAEVLAALVGAGARPDADVYRGTPAIWAAATGAAQAIRALLALGADPDGRGEFGGDTHGHAVAPLHMAAETGNTEVALLLLDAGADASAVDGHGYGTPEGWARHGGHPELADTIRARSRC